MSRSRWRLLLVLIDAVLVSAALYIALYLRFDGMIPVKYMLAYRQLVPFFTIVLLLSFYLFGLYNRLWQYASVGELVSITASITTATIVNFLILFNSARDGSFLLPRSVPALHWMATILLIGFSRFSWRFLRGILFKNRKPGEEKYVLIVGAGDAGATLVRELKQRRYRDNLIPVGFVDDNPTKQRMGMFGLPVLGRREDIPRLVQKYDVDEIIIAIPSASREVIGEIVDICQTTPASLKILPGIYELINGRVSVSQVREVRVEDILGREPVEVDLDSIAGYLTGKAILVTGAGGSIGSELCRQAARFKPRRLILLGHGENSIYEAYQDLSLEFCSLEIIPLICDVKDSAAMNAAFQKYRPEVVFHAAAHKHVPLMEHCPAEAVKNNVLGTFNAARAAHDFSAESFILISTDKAVHPAGIMGATKRIAEMVVQQMARTSKTCFASVRFGNVLDSRGSVVPLFKKQIASGGPVTVTHPEMVRYFMTIPEAVQLVIQAGALARGGEIFILDMGEPVKIISLARRMIRLAGYRPGKDIPIVFTGIRPGEKLYEELLTSAEETEATLHQSIFMARPDNNFSELKLKRFLNSITDAGWNPTREEVIALIRSVLPDFKNDSAGESRAIPSPSPGIGEL
ncbi:MAG TPA: nucleoside-diphosphate sugar epimerase/dehydratase [Bacillota bacterium]|jgi:FlaA1/EpsC-like NDP-sugar epimerase|nr:nucleoside-diphosphate sugar epimerase/dehydratase [Bacillota bacterium]HQE10810.1 nucleoside-diphosphate sugar epimerase/dehydratase [Bacillota bacterium]